MFWLSVWRGAIYRGQKGMAAGTRGWLVFLRLRSGSREWTVSGSRVNKLNALFFDCLSPVSLHLPKVPQPCQIAPPPGNHVCKHTSLCGAFPIQTTTDRCCVDSNECAQHKDWISLELLKCLSVIRSRLLVLLAEEQNRVGCNQWTICSVDRSQNWDSPYRHRCHIPHQSGWVRISSGSWRQMSL